MIGILATVAAVASLAPSAPPVDPAQVRCAFQTAQKLALASDDAPIMVANRVAFLCEAELPDTAPAMSEEARDHLRAAALAMVERQRGLDGQPADAPLTIAVPQNSLDIPDEIAPAVIPYLRCSLASAGQTEKSNGRVVPPPQGISKGSNCAAAREQAARNADRMLRARGGRGKAERQAFVEKALQDMDEFELAPPAKEEKSTLEGAAE
jgi:hypothetical protein